MADSEVAWTLSSDEESPVSVPPLNSNTSDNLALHVPMSVLEPLNTTLNERNLVRSSGNKNVSTVSLSSGSNDVSDSDLSEEDLVIDLEKLRREKARLDALKQGSNVRSSTENASTSIRGISSADNLFVAAGNLSLDNTEECEVYEYQDLQNYYLKESLLSDYQENQNHLGNEVSPPLDQLADEIYDHQEHQNYLEKGVPSHQLAVNILKQKKFKASKKAFAPPISHLADGSAWVPEVKKTDLPIESRKEDIVSIIRDNRVIILTGSTGCGKSTQVPQYILDDCLQEGLPVNIICTQPAQYRNVQND